MKIAREVLTLCLGYFLAYVVFGTGLKLLTNGGMDGMEVLFHTTIGSAGICILIVIACGWTKGFQSTQPKILWGLLPGEYKWLIPSGICTAVVIPTTTLMYTFGYSVMVAMVIMRSSLIITSLGVDVTLIKQGHSKKKIYWQELTAVALAAVSIAIIFFMAGPDDFKIFECVPAMVTMSAYIVFYTWRIYIMGRFKLKIPHKVYFGMEQKVSVIAILAASAIVIIAVRYFGWDLKQAIGYTRGWENTVSEIGVVGWWVGCYFGIAAFFSVFLYLYKGGNSVFNTTVNRITSLVAGLVSTLIMCYIFHDKPVKPHEWIAFATMGVATVFLALAGMRRQKEINAAAATTAVAT